MSGFLFQCFALDEYYHSLKIFILEVKLFQSLLTKQFESEVISNVLHPKSLCS